MQTWLGIAAIGIALISYSVYFRAIFSGQAKPHGMTWLIWAILNGLIFWQQLMYGGGAGAWVTGVAFLACIIIFFLAFRYGNRSVRIFDWLCLTAAAILLFLWVFGVDATFTVIIACIIFVVGFIPTFRKSYLRPLDETPLTFGLNSLKFFVALFALQSISLVTGLYPLTLAIMNGGFAIFLLIRRYTIHNKGGHHVRTRRS